MSNDLFAFAEIFNYLHKFASSDGIDVMYRFMEWKL